MKKLLLQSLPAIFFYTCFISGKLPAQPIVQQHCYQQTAERINDLVHTKIAVSFDYAKRYVYGQEWVTVRPHFYPTDSLRLDARGMEIHGISIRQKGGLLPLRFTYDHSSILIKLDRLYKSNETYTLFIRYTAKPDELKDIRKNERGVYFINPDSTEKDKPVQIWTEGETQNSSVWFPTIDRPNQKTTQEISITVPAKYVTLSNGKLTGQTRNTDGTRTDIWTMDKPHAPYLFMMAVGDFRVYRDQWKNREVSYYLEPRYAPFAKAIFGETPAAIDFFSRTLGVDYPWDKYSQIVVRDYISGAMENTTATVFGESMQGTPKELADRYYSTGIAHELFHQWFGDYVTAESWSNLTLNESMAVLGELLWLEYKYGKDAADAHNSEGLSGYLHNPEARTKELVRFHYTNRQDVFDGVTYQKGGSILYMLRSYLGPKAFNEGLKIYLIQNAWKAAEVHQLRLAFEEASGKDLNWFFDQWFFGAGHPDLHISYQWDETAKTQTVYLHQQQQGKVFILPMAIDVYVKGRKERYLITMKERHDTLKFTAPVKPDLVNADAEKVLVAFKTDDKTLKEYAFQYLHAPLYEDRLEALNAVISNKKEDNAYDIWLAALHDPFYTLRIRAIDALDSVAMSKRPQFFPALSELALYDSNNLVKAAAVNKLGKFRRQGDLVLFKKLLSAGSYTVQGASLKAIGAIDSRAALAFAKQMENDNKGAVYETIRDLYAMYGGDEQWEYMYALFQSLAPPKKYNIVAEFSGMVARLEKPGFAMQGIDAIRELGIIGKKYGVAPKIIELLTNIKNKRLSLNDHASAIKIIAAISDIEKAE